LYLLIPGTFQVWASLDLYHLTLQTWLRLLICKFYLNWIRVNRKYKIAQLILLPWADLLQTITCLDLFPISPNWANSNDCKLTLKCFLLRKIIITILLIHYLKMIYL
jgi:hypothetical protein